MIVLYLFVAFVFGFSTAALFSAKAYDKGYSDASEGGIDE